MISLTNIEVSEICNHLGQSKLINIQQIYGGSIHSSWRLDFKDQKIFLKKNIRSQKFLKFEKYCLEDLRNYIDHEDLIIPKVLKYFELNNVEILLMEWINMNNSNQKKLGKGLGLMHLNSNENNPKRFGYHIDGFIGTTKQIRGWEKNWADCFVKQRIQPQLLMLKDEIIDNEIIEKLKSKIYYILSKHKPMNSLVHGDLWSGNIGISNIGKGVIFDPASWWADNEADLAMTRLFGGFQKEFYQEYYKIIKIKPGLEKRRIIYNFYHILNHANMFGGSYLIETKNYIKNIMSM